jgi:hypothetical protein
VNKAEGALAAAVESQGSPWLGGSGFDLFFLILPGFACLLLLLPYVAYGPAVVMPIYSIYLVFFGLPHNYLTWATILPKTSRAALNWPVVKAMFLTSLGVCALLPLSALPGLAGMADWVLSAIAVLSIWHVYRQHHGIAKIYDAVQARRTGDRSIFEDRKTLNLFFGLASFGVLVWVFTHKDVRFLMSTDESYAFIHPVVSWRAYQLYLAVTAAAGVVGLKKAVYDRAKRGARVPWPQLALMTASLASFWGPYLLLPLDAIPLAMAIATIFHNVQYFGFVWLYERGRRGVPDRSTLGLSHRLAVSGRWKSFFGLGLVFSFAVIALYKLAPKELGTFVIYFIGVSHYLVDGSIWRGRDNRHLGPALARIAEGG